MKLSIIIATVLILIGELGAAEPRSAEDLIKDLAVAKYVVYAPTPRYPQEAWDRHWTGEGIFRLHIDPTSGQVKEIKILKSTGHRLLDIRLLQALVQWRFRRDAPEYIDVPISCRM